MAGGGLDVAGIRCCTGLGLDPHDSTATALHPATSHRTDRRRRADPYRFRLLLYQLVPFLCTFFYQQTYLFYHQFVITHKYLNLIQ